MKGVIIQLATAFTISIGNFLNGCSIVWTSDALATLLGNNSPLANPITSYEGSLIGSLPMLGTLVMAVVSGWLVDIMGRKRANILCGLCYVAAWSTMTAANKVPLILLGRLITGIANGIQIVAGLPFISEISQNNMQGITTSLTAVLYCFSTLVGYVNGWFLSYQAINYFNLCLSVIFVLLLSISKETPAFLLSKGDEKGALESLKYYRGESSPTNEILDELAYIKSQAEASFPEQSARLTEKYLEAEAILKDVQQSAWSLLRSSKANQRALITTAVYTVLMVLCGTVAVLAYAGPLFMRASPSLSPHLCSIFLSIAFTMGCLLTTLVIGFVGRRTLMISSAALSSLFLVMVASQLRWAWGPEWVILVAILGYCCCFQVGVGSVPVIQMSETFVPKLKSLTTVTVMCVMSLTNFLVLALFGPTVQTVGLDATFFIFSLCSAATATVAFFIMKETKGKTTEEIQGMYEQGYLYRREKKYEFSLIENKIDF